MARDINAQDRLDHVATLIANRMEAEVCSCYVMRAGEMLELYATEGLRKSAVHNTRLRIGEGLVGVIARQAKPLALADAQSHPDFVYRPETGEELFQSLMGVPIIRAGRVIGVLVVQNRSQRTYVEEEIELLETVAMVLAELVSSNQLIHQEKKPTLDAGGKRLPVRLGGMRLNAGVGIGVAVMHNKEIIVEKVVAEDPGKEHLKLEDALERMRHSLDEMFSAQDLAFGGEHLDVFETYRMFAEDEGWVQRIKEAINQGLTAEGAVQKVYEGMRQRMASADDAYLRERLHDFEDIAKRLLQHLVWGDQTRGGSGQRAALPENVVVVCKSMGPTELLEYDRERLRGLVMEEGSLTMHVTILARALDIPVVGRAKDASSVIEPLDTLIVDGDSAQVLVRPTDDVRRTFEVSVHQQEEKNSHYAQMRDLPAETLSGERINLMLNAGLAIDLMQLNRTGACGVGLYRTEIPFMARSSLPNVAAQTMLYSKILEAAEDRPVVFRTLDVGSDKLLPYWRNDPEPNPAMGWRSIRITLDRPAVMRHQLRAMVAAAAARDLYVMFPMVTEVAEFDTARGLLERELEMALSLGIEPPSKVQVGCMLEVPALAFQLKALLERVDFISVGSNDLAQFLFAVDRGNDAVADRYDVLSPAMLRFLRILALECNRAHVALSVCGEMAGRPLDAMALLGIGVRSLSMAAPSIGPVKEMVRSVSLLELEDFMERLYDLPSHSVREHLRSYAMDHNVTI